MKDILKLKMLLPKNIRVPLTELAEEENAEKRIKILEKMPKETLEKFLDASVYFLLKSGVTAKESVRNVLPKEVKEFIDRVRIEAEKTGELTKDSIKNAVNMVKATVALTVWIAVISLAVFLILNPAIAGVVIGASLILDIVFLLNPKKK